MKELTAFTPYLKIIYLLLIIFIMTIMNIILSKRQINSNYKYVINGITLIILALLTSYYSNIIEGIFNLKFLSVKFYLIILILTNIIMLLTIQKKIKLIYKITNYILFILNTIILSIIIILTITLKLNILPTTYNQYPIALLNLSIITFITYLAITCFIYIILYLIKKKPTKATKKTSSPTLTEEELLTLPDKTNFTINGVDCSIIFEDSIKENIIKNYHILLNNINDPLVNGYTLEENKILKSICTKLQVNNLNYIDINNISILNKINIEEYNFLKHIHEKESDQI